MALQDKLKENYEDLMGASALTSDNINNAEKLLHQTKGSHDIIKSLTDLDQLIRLTKDYIYTHKE